MLGLTKKFGCLVVGATLLLATVGARGQFSERARPHPGTLCGRGRGRRARAHARTVAGQDLGPAARDREPSRRRWHRRFTGADASGAGRHHVDPSRERHPLNQFIYPKLPYDTFKDFTAISEIASSPLAILVSRTSPYANLQDLLAAARKDPDSLSYGMAGNGTSSHLAGELLKYMAGVKIVAVPYKGGAPALTAVIAGDIPLSFNPLAEAIGQIGGGSLRAIAVTSDKRSSALPDVPTVAESGVPGYDVSVWWGFLGPAHMAPEIVAKLETDLKTALQDPSVQSTLEKIGATPVGSGSKEFEAFMHSEAEKWQPVLKTANIRAE
jgi:tripartite-type tricarboxylate transporter receptor subunit TctC